MLTERQKLTINPLTLTEGVAHKVKDVYVPLGLVERKKQSKQKDDVSAEQGSDLYKETEITRTFKHEEFLEEVLRQKQSPKSQGKRLAIIGEPGAGKTTFLQHIADWVSSEIKQAIVIWISLADLQEQTLEEYLYGTWLTAATRRTYKGSITEQDKDDFATQFQPERMWLFLDGLDEMFVSSNNPVTEIARQISLGGSISQARIVLTCRVNLWDGSRNQLDDFDIYRTFDFSYPYQVEMFIERWFSVIPGEGRERGKRLCTALRETGKKRIQDLVRNPLRLTLLCLNWQSREGNLPDTQAGLYQQFLDEFYEWKENIFDIKYDQRKELNVKLAELAKEAIDRETSHFRLQHKLVSHFLGEPNDEKSLLKLALKLGWLNNIGITPDRKPVYAFYHATFEEYFAALAINDWHFFLNHFHKNPNHCNASYRIFEPQWKEVILLWLGRKDIPKENKEEFIKALVNFKDDCGEWGNIDSVNKGFYEFKAYFIAVQGIAEFNDCSLSGEIVQQIIRYSFGYLNEKTKAQWESFLWGISNEALSVFPTTNKITNKTKVIEDLIAVIREIRVNNDTRMQASVLLGKIDPGNQTVIEGLIAVIRDPQVDSYTCRQAAVLLGKIDPGNRTAIEGLIAVIRDPQVDSDIKRHKWAAESLREIDPGNRTAIEGLITVIRDPQVDSYRRGLAAECLGKIDPGNQTAIEGFIKVIHDPLVNSYAFQWVAEGLEEIGIGNQTVIEGLIAVIRDPQVDSYRRSLAAKSLGKIDPGNQTAIEGLIAVIHDPQVDSKTRVQAAESLEKIDPGNRTAIEGLIAVIRDKKVDSETRVQAAESLGEIDPGNQTVIEGLIAVIRDPQVDSETRVQAAESLEKIDPGNQTAIEGLIAVIRDKKVYTYTKIRPESLRKIGVGNQTAIKELITVICDSKVALDRRMVAVKILGKIGVSNQTAIKELIAVIRDEKVDSDTRSLAALSLGIIDPGNQTAIEGLIAAIRDKKVNLYTYIITAVTLGKIDPGNRTAIEGLIAVIRDKKVDSNTRKWAAESLEIIDPGNQTTIEGLIAVISDKRVPFYTFKDVAERLVKLNPDNQTTIERLIAVICDEQVDSYIRKLVAQSLRNIVVEKHMVYVVSLLKNYLSYKTYKNGFALFSMCYPIFRDYAKKMAYPKFYEAWLKSIS